MSRKWLIILPLLFLPFLVLGIRKKTDPFSNLGDYSYYKPWIKAMAKHETGNYTSRVYKQLNNLFGMKNASRRPQLGSQVAGETYRVYSSPGESVQDLIKYFDYVGFPKKLKGVDEFVQQLKIRKYFEDSYSNYLNGVKSWL